MYWFIVLFPLMIYPWGYDPYYTTTKTYYLYIFVIGTWIYIIFKRKFRTIFPEKSYSAAEITLLVFLSLILISTLFSHYKYSSIYGTIDRKEGLITYFSYFSVFIFSYRLLKEHEIIKVISGMAIVSIVVSIYGILQFYWIDFLPRNSAMIHFNRAYAFFDHANFFGSYLVMIMLLTMTVYLTTTNKKLFILYYVTICLAFISLIFSNTRSAYVGVFCGIVFLSIFVIIKKRELWKKWVMLLMSLASLFLIINVTERGQSYNRVSTIVTESYSIATNQSTGNEGSSRIFIWKHSLPFIKDYFWLGSGPDSFGFIFPAITAEHVDKAHNEYLQIAITLGIPALLAYLIFLFLIFRKASQALKKAQDNDRVILYGLIATIIGYLVQAFFNISTVPVAPFFWSLLGFTMAKSIFLLKNSQ